MIVTTLYTICFSILAMVSFSTSLAEEHSFRNSLFYNDHNLPNNYIERAAFQSLCNYRYDPQAKVQLNPKSIQAGDIILVNNVDEFMKNLHPQIEKPYIMLTHLDARVTNHSYQLKYLDDKKIIAWFSIHPTQEGHKKYFPIPLGTVQYSTRSKIELNNLFKQLRHTSPKKHLAYMSYYTASHGERKLVQKLFADKRYCFVRKDHISFDDYAKEMAQCKFTFSPRGVGPDCFRTWEAIIVGSIPIVRRCTHEHASNKVDPCNHSQLDDLYKDLPVLVVDAWEQITEEFLKQKYREITSKTYNIAPLYLDYWRAKIMKVRNDFLATYH